MTREGPDMQSARQRSSTPPVPRTTSWRTGLLLAAPRLLFALWLVVLAVGLWRHAPHLQRPLDLAATVMFGGYLAWGLAEVPVTFRRTGAAPAESATLLMYAIARLALVTTAAVWPPVWTEWSPWLALPMAVFAGGIALRQVAIWTLGRFYSHHVVRQRDHSVVSHGVYRFLRHPAYAGMVTAHIGFTAFFLSPLSAICLIALVAAVVRRILIEEGVLYGLPGYADYARGRARLCTGLW
ncbi:isoprenylcysteine carboxylmethyltransferase family protein [Sphaerisporangium sp. TRM90804]|uniref:methyltransferase family protein n=1 Tax=Sphaerisporangium sp. TRM90804 TaxID=3031113 RepID=UPI0024471C39|nr:isoprenylcysteine carboxylmethyltransferase family protein [Sphaerisporangium sp. TRM90804]MDH2430336.1 isoprenylcysteine carboxylmethyltransferase family protein [Sphaerisporangium sp. TRM90804]